MRMMRSGTTDVYKEMDVLDAAIQELSHTRRPDAKLLLLLTESWTLLRSELHRFMGEPEPIPMILICPACLARHIDKGEFSTKPHHTHACQDCGMVWRPAIVPTVGVQYLPGFKDPP